MEEVFRALADPTRRLLLDRLFRRDGQTLHELTEGLDMTRFGVMKHLRILEGARLVVTRKAGREKLHYLNPVPIRELHDRWIDKYAEPWLRGLGELKSHLEGSTMSDRPRHVYETYIRTTPEQLWEAITTPELTTRYFFQTAVGSDFTPGSRITYSAPDGTLILDGEVLEVEPGRKLVQTFIMEHDPEGRKDRPSRVTWEIAPQNGVCKLTLVHDDFDGETRTYREVAGGWTQILDGLKTLLETGEPLFGEPAA